MADEPKKKQRATELDVDFSLDEINTEIIEHVVEAEEEGEELEGELSPEEEKAQKIKLIAMGAVGLILIGAVVWFFVFSEPEEEVDVPPPLTEQADEDLPELPEHEKYVPPPSYTIEPFFIADHSKGSKKGAFVRVAFQFILSNETVGNDLDRSNTDLRKNLYTVLKNKGVEDIRNERRRERLKKELIIAANRILQRGTVYDVFITTYFVK